MDMPRGDAERRLGHLRACAADSTAVQGCTGWSPLCTDAEAAFVRRANRGDQEPVERHLCEMVVARLDADQVLGI